MAPHEWATAAQNQFLHDEFPTYMKAKENQAKVALTRYWNQLEEKYFAHWPAEAVLEIPVPGQGSPPAPLTAEQTKILGKQTTLAKGVSGFFIDNNSTTNISIIAAEKLDAQQ